MQAEKIFPKYKAGVWRQADAVLKERFLQRGERLFSKVCNWHPFAEQAFSEYFKTGVRAGYESVYFKRRTDLASVVLAECLECKGRYFPDILAGLRFLCEEPTWCLPAHLRCGEGGMPDLSRPEIDLFAAETAAQLTAVLYMLGGELLKRDAELAARVRGELQSRVKEPYLARSDMWWLGEAGQKLNNWSTWISANMLIVFLLGEEDERLRTRGVQKACATLARYCGAQPCDGECEEGAAYWNVAAAALFNAYEVLSAFGEEDLLVGREYLQQAAGYPLSQYIGNGAFVNFGDCPMHAMPDFATIFRYAEWAEDGASAVFAARAGLERDPFYAFDARGTCELMFFRAAAALFTYPRMRARRGEPLRLPPFRFYKCSGRLTVRMAGGMFLAAKGAAADVAHDHCDAGNFLLYKGGSPVVIDIGKEASYTAASFSGGRDAIWFVRTAYHNLPVFNGTEQTHFRMKAAAVKELEMSSETLRYALELGGTYAQEAGIGSFLRRFVCDLAGGCVCVENEVVFSSSENTAAFMLLTVCPPAVEGNVVRIGGCILRVESDTPFGIGCEERKLTDPALAADWGGSIYRLQVVFPQCGRRLAVRFMFA